MELGRSNVCTGVERGWPKRMFSKPNFNDLEPKEKRCIYRTMERKAVFLYNRYVDVNRLKQRCRRRTTNALAYYYEERYRKQLFKRIKALGEQGNSANYQADNETINDGEMTDDESDDERLIIDESAANEPGLRQYAYDDQLMAGSSIEDSLITVINTGSTARGELKKRNRREQSEVNGNNNMDVDDDDDSIDFMLNDENDPNNGRSVHTEKSKKLPKHSTLNKRQLSKVQHTSIRNPSQSIIDLVQSESEELFRNLEDHYPEANTDDRFNNILSQSVVSSTSDSTDETPLRVLMSSPIIDYTDPVNIFTPDIGTLRNLRRHVVDVGVLPSSQFEESSEIDSIDFLSQGMQEARTSTP